MTTDQAPEPPSDRAVPVVDESIPGTWDEVVAWLETMSPIPRARLLAVLVDAKNTVQLAAMRKAAVAEASIGYGAAAEVAAALGMSVRRVYKTVSEHRAAQHTSTT